MWLLLIMLVIAAAAGLAAYSLLDMLFGEERRVARRLRSLSDFETEQARAVEPLLKPFSERALVPLVNAFAQVGRILSPGDYRDRLKERLVTAGEPRGMSVDRFLAAKVVAGVATFLFMTFLGLVGSGSAGRFILMALILSPAAFYVPDLWLRSAISRRRLEIRRALPDMLDMLTISVESGMGFDGAVAKLVRTSSGALAEEFARMLQQVQAGVARRDAFKHMADRVRVPELNTFIASMVQAEVFGIAITKVLRTQAREMRVRRRQFAEEMAQKAPVKIVFPLVLCILPATLIVLAGPAVLAIGRAFGLIAE